jgi:cation transport regulator ChaB
MVDKEYEAYLASMGVKPETVKQTGPAIYPTPTGRINYETAAEQLQSVKPEDYGRAMSTALGGGLVQGLGKGVLAQAAEGALLGAAQAPEGQRGIGALLGGSIQGGMSGIGKLLGKTGDVSMQAAVGRKKYTPGVGTELADQGVIGTKRMMSGQVANRLGTVGKEMADIAETIPSVNSRAIGKELLDEAMGPYTGGGIVQPSARDLEAVKTIQEFADDVASRGSEKGRQALARRSAAGSSAYSARSDLPKQNLMSQLSKKEQQLYSKALKEAGGPKMAKADTSYAALKKAEKALAEEPSLPRSLMGLASLPATVLPGAPIAASAIGQAGVKGGRLAEFLAPISRQAASSAMSSVPSEEEEMAEYEAYLRSMGK